MTATPDWRTALGGLLEGLLDVALPARCVVCRRAGAWLCESCAPKLHALPSDSCRGCGSPAASQAGVCPECHGRSFGFVGARAAFAYDGAARALVTACKFRGLRSLADEMVRLSLPAFSDFAAELRAPAERARVGQAPAERARVGQAPAERALAEQARARRAPVVAERAVSEGALDETVVGGIIAADTSAAGVVTWVPAHRGHALERGFNVAELLARGLAAGAGLPALPLLERVQHGARQEALDRGGRAANVASAYVLKPVGERVDTMQLKRVIVVDDVYTTGETLSRCAEALAEANLEPYAFTFARTVRRILPSVPIDDAFRKERCR